MNGRWPLLLTQADAAELLSVSVDTIQRLRQAGEIRTVLVRGTLPRYKLSELEKFAETLPRGTGQFNGAKEIGEPA